MKNHLIIFNHFLNLRLFNIDVMYKPRYLNIYKYITMILKILFQNLM